MEKDKILDSIKQCAIKYKKAREELMKLEKDGAVYKLETIRKEMFELAMILVDEISKEV